MVGPIFERVDRKTTFLGGLEKKFEGTCNLGACLGSLLEMDFFC